MKKEKLMVSSCLLGELVKYNGGHNLIDEDLLIQLEQKYELFPFCPEVEAGMDIPRVPCEIISTDPIQVVNKNYKDKTQFFLLGANKALDLCKKENIKKALLKANSPSCSSETIYDGTFSGITIFGFGVTTNLLKKCGITIFDETRIDELLN